MYKLFNTKNPSGNHAKVIKRCNSNALVNSLIRHKWIPLISLFPILYLLGWLITQPFRLSLGVLSEEDYNLIGTIFSLIIFILILPFWIDSRWNLPRKYRRIFPIEINSLLSLAYLIRGLLSSIFLILVLILPLLYFGYVEWIGVLNKYSLLNAIALCFGVGFAEELIFRHWFLGEMKLLVGSKWAIYVQAFIFSIAHIRSSIDLIPLISLLFGLFLLGILLAQRKNLDRGSLLGAIGMHGGLVGGWFLLKSGLIQISETTPQWLIGPGVASPNPLGGLLGIFALLILMFYQLIETFSLRASLRRTVRASSREDNP